MKSCETGEGPGKARSCWRREAEGKRRKEEGGEEARELGGSTGAEAQGRTRACERQQARLQGGGPRLGRCPGDPTRQARAGWQQGPGFTALVTCSWTGGSLGLEEKEEEEAGSLSQEKLMSSLQAGQCLSFYV